MKVKVRNAHHEDTVDEYIDKSDAVKTRLGEDYNSWEQCLVFEVENLEELINRIDYNRLIVTDMDEDGKYDYSIQIYDYYVE